jgi:hypothetical protein
VEVSDALFAALREHFDEVQLGELASVIALENRRGRFNLALGVGAAGFSEGMVWARLATGTDALAKVSFGTASRLNFGPPHGQSRSSSLQRYPQKGPIFRGALRFVLTSKTLMAFL